MTILCGVMTQHFNKPQNLSKNKQVGEIILGAFHAVVDNFLLQKIFVQGVDYVMCQKLDVPILAPGLFICVQVI